MEHKINTDHKCSESPTSAHFWIGTNAKENGWELSQCKWCLEIRWFPYQWELAYSIAMRLKAKKPPVLPKVQ